MRNYNIMKLEYIDINENFHFAPVHFYFNPYVQRQKIYKEIFLFSIRGYSLIGKTANLQFAISGSLPDFSIA